MGYYSVSGSVLAGVMRLETTFSLRPSSVSVGRTLIWCTAGKGGYVSGLIIFLMHMQMFLFILLV